jgi:hypothetical protein
MRIALVGLITLLCTANVMSASAQQIDTGDTSVRRVHLGITYSLNVPGGGWRWGEAMTATALRVELDMSRRALTWVNVGRAEINNVGCADVPGLRCTFEGTPWLLHGGIGYRFGEPGAHLVPYVGAGAGVIRWDRGGSVLTPQVHTGVDWIVLRRFALRVEGQRDWQGARIGSGIRLSAP